jgi:DNA-directed RNA polymerase specialized sigma24 family protein
LPRPFFERGDPQAAEQLLALVYKELRKLAATKLSQEKPGQTPQATALVHEAYIGWWTSTRPGTGPAGAISLPLRPRRCGGF